MRSGKITLRIERCPCGSRFESEQKITRRLTATGSTPVARRQHARGSPAAAPTPPNATGSPPAALGGVGGGLPSGQDPDSGSVPDLDPLLVSDQREDGARPRRRRTVESEAFTSWWSLYPRKVGKAKALEAWTRLELDARAAAVMTGLNAQLGYYRAQPIDKVPHPTTWLNAGRWDDDPAAYVISRPGANGSAPDTRCTWHREPKHDGSPSKYPDKRCERCRHFLARGAGRTGEPETAANVMPSWGQVPPPPAWTAEQIAEAEDLRRQRKPNGGTP